MIEGINAKMFIGTNPCAEIPLEKWELCSVTVPKKRKKIGWKRIPKKAPRTFFIDAFNPFASFKRYRRHFLDYHRSMT